MRYTVLPGDSLDRIAQQFAVPLPELIRTNPQFHDPNSIYPGEIVTIPLIASPAPHQGIPRLEVPYPPVRVEEKNPDYAQILQEDYAGRVSETGAVMQYFYHHLSMEATPKADNAATLVGGISVIEMEHMDLIGQVILLLGGAPRYQDAQNLMWTPAYVEYLAFDTQAQLEADIRAEEAAIAQYQEHIRHIGDPYVQALLARIIKDEEFHIRLFSRQLDAEGTGTSHNLSNPLVLKGS